MLAQLATAITFDAFFTSSKTGKTGLTVTVDVYKNDTKIVTAASATEIGGGLYRYALSSGSVDTLGNYIAIFKTADSTVDVQHVPSLWNAGQTFVQNLDAAITVLTGRLTSVRAGYIDNLNISDTVASSSEVGAIYNNVDIRMTSIDQFQKPASGTASFPIYLRSYSADNTMEDLDDVPAISASLADGTSRNSRLSALTMNRVSEGFYVALYTEPAGGSPEVVVITAHPIKGGNGRDFDRQVTIVDAITADFTIGDRNKLDAIFEDYARRTGDYATPAAIQGIADTLDNLPTLGDGPYAITVQTDPAVVGASVSLSQGIDSPSGTTGADGSVTFHVQNLGEYDLIAAKAGYTSYTGTVDVTGDETETIELPQVVITPPAEPGLCKPYGYFKHLDQTDAPVKFTFTLMSQGPVNNGRMLVERQVDYTADANGEIGTNDDNTLLLDRTDTMDVEGKVWKIDAAAAGIVDFYTPFAAATFDLNSIPLLIEAAV